MPKRPLKSVVSPVCDHAPQMNFDVPLVDTHCHLDQFRDPEAVVRNLRGGLVIAVTTAPSTFAALKRRIGRTPGVRIALGAHPHHVADFPPVEWRLFESYLPTTHYVGEVGLDFSSRFVGTREAQVRAFRRVLTMLGDRTGTPRVSRLVSVHSRRAEGAVLDLLVELRIAPVVFHWYTGSSANLERLLAEGHYCSFNPAMLRTRPGSACIRRVPPERALCESDGPFVRVNGGPARPFHVAEVYARLATEWGVPITEVAARNMANLRMLMGA